MGGDENRMILITPDDEQSWPRMSKAAAARRLAAEIASAMGK
jgi:phosphopantothenoylcysteine synthetase/decarboxylase